MLRLTRGFHQTARTLNESSVQVARTQIDEYLQYFKTQRELRPLVYRKKNSSELLSRDLFDEETKSRIVPLDPPQLPAKSALSKLIQSSESVDALYKIRDELLALSKKPKFATGEHLNVYLEKSAELNKLPHALTFIYSQKTLRELLNQENLNLISTFLYLNPNKNLEQKLQKLTTASQKIRSGNLISKLLKASVYSQFKAEIPAELLNEIRSASKLESVPQLDLTKGTGNLAKQFTQNRTLYLQLKPVDLELSQSDLATVESVQQVLQFVKDFETVSAKLNKRNQFEELKEKSLFESAKKEQEKEAPAEE